MYSNKYVTELITDGIIDEIKNGNFYLDLANIIKDNDDKKMIEQISLDENKHYKMLMDIYEKLIKEKFTPDNNIEIEIDKDIIKNIVNAFKGELEAVEFYRPILFALENQQFKNYITEIISDEQNHAAKLNYLYSKYK